MGNTLSSFALDPESNLASSGERGWVSLHPGRPSNVSKANINEIRVGRDSSLCKVKLVTLECGTLYPSFRSRSHGV